MSVGKVLKGIGVGAAKGAWTGTKFVAKEAGSLAWDATKMTAKATGHLAYQGAKATGKVVKAVDKIGDATAGKLGEKIVDAVHDNADAIGGAIKNGVKGSFVPLPKDSQHSVFQKLVKHRLHNGVAGAVIAGGGAITVGNMLNEGNNVGKLGKIQADEMANMVSFTRSPELEETIDAMDSNEAFSKERTEHMFGTNTHGAEGDLVFALHNLRNR